METRSTWTHEQVAAFLARPIPRVRASPLYAAGLVMVALALVLLQAVYAAMVGLAAYGTIRYVLAIPALLNALGTNQLSILLAVAPVVAGVILTFFLLKPFLARPVRQPDLIRVERSEQPLLYAFVDRLCDRLGAPHPSAIELDLKVNASARLNGFLSLFRSRLTLTIGIPLAAGMTLPQFSAILAHEFGHFSQWAGMRLYFLIETIRQWFTRVAYERDQWDAWLESSREDAGWRMQFVLGVAALCVTLSREVLRALLFCSRAVSAWFSRQMEFNADRHAAELVGEAGWRDTLRRVNVLDAECQAIWGSLVRAFESRRLCDDFAVVLRARDEGLGDGEREAMGDASFQLETDRWATHPCDRERIEKVRGVAGVIAASETTAAEVLFQSFDRLCRDVTLFHYRLHLGEALRSTELVDASRFASEASRSSARVEAIATFFGALRQPTRYFRLAEPGTASNSIELRVHMSDVSGGYWEALDESLLRNAALEFVRGGGRVNPEVFRLSNGEHETILAEAADSRRRVDQEAARLAGLCAGQSQLLAGQGSAFADAYRVLSSLQPALLDLRHRFVAADILAQNLNCLPAAAAANASQDKREELRSACQVILETLSRSGSPLTPGTSLAEEALGGRTADSTDPSELAAHLLNRVDAVADELLGELCLQLSTAAPLASGDAVLSKSNGSG